MSIIATEVRRQTVTVLFVDIVGFTALIEDLDCAEVRALQMDYFAAVSSVVRDCGGVVEKYVGDAVMAVFGLSAQCPAEGAAAAVRAGLAVQEALRGRRLGGRCPVRTRVGAVTREVTDAAIAYQELPPVAVAGKPYPLDLWRALHPQAAMAAALC